MAIAAVTRAIKDLKTDADKLSPKPSVAFDNLYKAQSPAVITAAKAIDTLVAGKDASTAPAALKNFTAAASKFFTNLGNVATKEPAAIKGKLGSLVDAAEKEAVAACKSEIDAFVKFMASRTQSADAAIAALEEHIDLRKRGVKEVMEHRTEAQKALVQVKANRTKGEDGLEDSQKILHKLRIAESTVAQKGAFLKGQTPLASEFSKALDSGSCPKDVVARLRKEDETAHNDGMRIMAQSRDIRAEIYTHVIEHQEEVDRAAAIAAKSERGQTAQVKKLESDFKKFSTGANKVFDKLDKSAWGKIETLTKSGDEEPYKAIVRETTEAFEALPGMNTALQKIVKPVEALRDNAAKEKGDTAKEITDAVDKLYSKVSKLQLTLRTTTTTHGVFKKLVADCDQAWKKRKGRA